MRANPTDLPAEPVTAGCGFTGRDSAGHDSAGHDFAGRDSAGSGQARQAVTALYQAHALGLIRLAVVMLGDQPAAEDVVQEAFCGLYRRWHALSDTERALSYVRSSVINGCRSVLRRRVRQLTGPAGDRPGGIAGDRAGASPETARGNPPSPRY